MTFPPLLLGLHAAALLVALLVSSWLSHSCPLSADGRRVADAAERAGIEQNLFALRYALGPVVLVVLVSGWVSSRAGGSSFWFGGLPLVVGISALTTGLGVARFSARAASRHLSRNGQDQSATLSARTALVATLIPEAVCGLLVLGTFALAERSLGARAALQMAFLVAGTVAILSVVFTRTTAAFTRCVEVEAPPGLATPHPCSLAQLVARGFGRSLVSTAALMTTSCLGHAVLLAHSVALSGEASPSAILYPHLLRSLGLLALLFGGMVVRSSEREPFAWAWSRGAAVTLVLLIAGAWSLSQSLQQPWERILPGGATLAFLGAGISLAFIGQRLPTRPSALGFPPLAWAAAWALLLAMTFAALRVAARPVALPGHLLHGLILGCVLSLLPLAQLWRVARESADSAQLSSALAQPQGQGNTALETRAPPSSWTDGYWLLVLMVGLGATQLADNTEHEVTLLGIGMLLGLTSLLAVLSRSLRACRQARSETTQLLRDHQLGAPSASATRFGDALDIAKNSGRRGLLLPVLFVIGSSLLWLLGLALPELSAAPLTLGFTLGVLFAGAAIAWLFEGREPHSLTGHSSFAAVLALSLVTWITTGVRLL